MTTIPMNATVAFLAERFNKAPSWYRYANTYDMLADLATPVVADIRTDDAFGDLAQLQHCFLNCWNIVNDFTGYTYCEGLALRMGVWIDHAWVIDEQGTIIDPTWSLLESSREDQRAIYQGIPFADEFLFRHGIERGWVAFISSDWRWDHPALKRGFIFDDAGRACDYGPIPKEDA